MLSFILRRVLIGLITIYTIGTLSFFIINLPSGDYLNSYIAELERYGQNVSRDEIQTLRNHFGLDKPVYVQYFKWAGNMLRGNFGLSLEHQRPVRSVIGDRLLLTVVLTLATTCFTWIIALPIGVYSAVRKNSIGDYSFTFAGYLGLALPDFLLALVLMYLAYVYFGSSIGGLFSQDYVLAPWSIGRVVDLLSHLWIPAIVLGTSGTAGLIRIMRANLLDELYKPYVVTARAKGLGRWRTIVKYPVRMALNPFVSTIGYLLPGLVSGSVIVAVVMSLPTLGPVFLAALFSQDMFLAGTILTLLGVLTVVGTLVSDILLALVDPRIRMEQPV